MLASLLCGSLGHGKRSEDSGSDWYLGKMRIPRPAASEIRNLYRSETGNEDGAVTPAQDFGNEPLVPGPVVINPKTAMQEPLLFYLRYVAKPPKQPPRCNTSQHIQEVSGCSLVPTRICGA